MRGWWIRQSSTAMGRQLRARLNPSAGGASARPRDDVELTAQPVAPRIAGTVDARRRVLDALAVQRVEHDVALQVDLVRVVDVLQLAAAACRNVRTRRRDAMRRRLDNAHHLGEARRALLVPDRHLDLLAGDPALDEHGRALFVVGKAQSTVNHAPEAHLATAPRAVSRSRRFTSGMSALPPVASFTERIS